VTFVRNTLPVVQHSNEHNGSSSTATCPYITTMFHVKCSLTNVRGIKSQLYNTMQPKCANASLCMRARARVYVRVCVCVCVMTVYI